MITYFLASASLKDVLSEEKRFVLFISLPLLAVALTLLCLFRSEPRIDILVLLFAVGTTWYALGFTSLALFKSLTVALKE